jgi:hypothetical protein
MPAEVLVVVLKYEIEEFDGGGGGGDKTVFELGVDDTPQTVWVRVRVMSWPLEVHINSMPSCWRNTRRYRMFDE